VFYTDRTDVSAFGGCRVVPTGVLHQLLRPGESGVELPVSDVPPPPTDPDDFLECHLAASVLFWQGQSLARAGRLDEARARYRAAAGRCGENPIVLRQLALAHRDLGDAETAESLLRRTLAIAPADGDALFDLGSLLSRLGRSEEAVRVFDRLLEAGFDRPEVHLARGVQLVRLGDLAGATKSAVRALELEPGLEPAQRLAEAVARGYRIGGEAGLLEARRGLGMIGLEGTLELAGRYLEKGEIDRATDLYREASQSAPDNVDAAYGLGYGLLQIGRWREAGEAFRQVLSVDPESAGGRNALAYVFALTGDSLDVAERLAEEALELDPSLSGYGYDTLGWVLHRQGRPEAALEALREAKRRIPPDDVSMKAENDYHLGVVLLTLDRVDEARDHLRGSLSLAGDEPWVPDLKAKAREAGLAEGDA
jgi:tetratricopeptide (TPR) repeat protein